MTRALALWSTLVAAAQPVVAPPAAQASQNNGRELFIQMAYLAASVLFDPVIRVIERLDFVL